MISLLKYWSIFSAITWATVSATSPATAESRLVSPQLEGYIVGYEASNATQSIQEEIPAGETLENWTSMVTTQQFFDTDLTALQFAEAIQSNVNKSCEKLSQGKPTALKHQEYDGASYSATCLSTRPHGGPETFFLMVIRTPDTLHVKQVAFRDC